MKITHSISTFKAVHQEAELQMPNNGVELEGSHCEIHNSPFLGSIFPHWFSVHDWTKADFSMCLRQVYFLK